MTDILNEIIECAWFRLFFSNNLVDYIITKNINKKAFFDFANHFIMIGRTKDNINLSEEFRDWFGEESIWPSLDNQLPLLLIHHARYFYNVGQAFKI
jgi:hypothetical protein